MVYPLKRVASDPTLYVNGSLQGAIGASQACETAKSMPRLRGYASHGCLRDGLLRPVHSAMSAASALCLRPAPSLFDALLTKLDVVTQHATAGTGQSPPVANLLETIAVAKQAAAKRGDVEALAHAVEQIRNTLSCPLSCGLLYDPVILNCSHVFEWTWIKRALEHKDECPMCKSPQPQLDDAPSVLGQAAALMGEFEGWCGREVDALCLPPVPVASQPFLTLARAVADASQDGREAAVAHALAQLRHVDDMHDGQTMLHYAVMCDCPDLLSELLIMGANPSIRSSAQRTPLHTAATFGNVDLVRLLVHFGADVEALDGHGRTPLVAAISQDRESVVAALLASNADPNRGYYAIFHMSPLNLALSQCNAAIALQLLEGGADVNEGQEYLLIRLALESRHVALAERVFIAAADPVDLVGLLCSDAALREMPLHLAVSHNRVAFAEALCRAGCPVNARDHRGRTPLTLAVMGGHVELVRLLMAASADKMAVDANGHTPLQLALQSDHEEMLACLLAPAAFTPMC